MPSTEVGEPSNGIFNIQIGDELTWNVKPILHEISHALDALLSDGVRHIIDLRSIPLAPGEEDRIIATLGQGEVQVRIDALGPSEVVETRFTGVWLVTHYNEDEQIISRLIEITEVPDILVSPREDMRHASSQLNSLLQDWD